ncbi:hypothetical protein ASPBRDRAFT_310138 [Aspergillus brasiliensis CBS 101740]|uniref:Protein kinase domain-containing protein n=1 Tax=Aspergillus brasiliensis (strain CBS 101740 / IMI 381727 / IBT 21946) TaxID=767769 RepID=A0A1L9UAQ2_ASPBC|nr:hypothetical protein ASPBRDRAFT_310138 [Aspergillus brasiliensis CBS 101740]
MRIYLSESVAFGEASLLPIDTDMETAGDGGYSIQTDIGQLGTVIYEVIARQICGFDLFREGVPLDSRATWPRRDSLPSTDGLWLGSIIEKCWGFKIRMPYHRHWTLWI